MAIIATLIVLVVGTSETVGVGVAAALAQQHERAAKHASLRAASGFMLRGAKGPDPLLYISDNGRGTVTVFSQNHPGLGPVGKITGLDAPLGIAVDAQSNLWVQVAGQIEAFHHGATTPFESLPASGGAGLAFDGHGNMYAATSGNEIDLYPPGARKPTKRFVDPRLLGVWAIAVDDVGDVFCSGYFQYISSPEQFAVDEFIAGTSRIRRLYALGHYGGLSIGSNQELLVQDGSSVVTFPKPYTKPDTNVLNYGEVGEAMALSSTLRSVWVTASSSFGQGQQYNLASGRRTHQTKHGGMSSQVFGIALDPAAI